MSLDKTIWGRAKKTHAVQFLRTPRYSIALHLYTVAFCFTPNEFTLLMVDHINFAELK